MRPSTSVAHRSGPDREVRRSRRTRDGPASRAKPDHRAGRDHACRRRSREFTAQARFTDGAQRDVTDDATWRSTEPSRLTHDGRNRFQALAEGTAQVHAVYQQTTAQTEVAVVSSPLTALEVVPTVESIEVNETVRLRAFGTYPNGARLDIADAVTWSTSDEAVAGVDVGHVTGRAPGAVQITATLDNIETSASLTVLPPRMTGLSIEGSNLPIAAGLSRQLDAVATWSSSATTSVTATVEWASNQPDVATVVDGLVRARRPSSRLHSTVSIRPTLARPRSPFDRLGWLPSKSNRGWPLPLRVGR